MWQTALPGSTSSTLLPMCRENVTASSNLYKQLLPERYSPVVICTELKNYPGQFVTNAAEQIAGEVLSFNRLPTPVVWIEHYENGARGHPRTRTASTW
jgi:hypothetical protein